MTTRRSAASLGLLLLAGALLPGCGPLSQGARTGLLVADTVACSALTIVLGVLVPPAGAAAAAACPGEEQLVKNALDNATPEPGPDGGVGTAAAAVVAGGPPPPRPTHVALYHRRRGGGRRHVGYAERSLCASAQAWLDAHPEQ